MKYRIKIILLFTLISYFASAQRNGFSIEPCIGFGTSACIQNSNNKAGERLGCGLVYMFSDHMGVSAGLQFQHYAAQVISLSDSMYFRENPATSSYTEYNHVTANYNFAYAEIPISIRYISSQDQKIGVFAEVGIVLGYMLISKESGVVSVNDVDTSLGGNDNNSSIAFGNINPKTSPFNVQGHLSLGAVNPINSKCSLVTEVSFNKGFTNVGNSSNDFVNTPLANPFYYYNKGNNFNIPSVSDYGTGFSVLISVRLIIKLDSDDTAMKNN
jgi:hypothetical protein